MIDYVALGQPMARSTNRASGHQPAGRVVWFEGACTRMCD